MLVKICFLCLEHGDSGLSLLILSFLGGVILSHLFFGSLDFFDKSLSNISSFLGKILLKILLFRAQSLNLVAVEVELFIQCLCGLFETGNLALKGSIKCVTGICRS